MIQTITWSVKHTHHTSFPVHRIYNTNSPQLFPSLRPVSICPLEKLRSLSFKHLVCVTRLALPSAHHSQSTVHLHILKVGLYLLDILEIGRPKKRI